MSFDINLAARVVAGVRATIDAPPWDAPGIAAALREVGGTPGAAFAAACLAAEDPTLRSPSPGAFRLRWPAQAISGPSTRYDQPCPEHHLTMPCRACAAAAEADAIDDEQRAELVAQMRQAIRDNPPPQPKDRQ